MKKYYFLTVATIILLLLSTSANAAVLVGYWDFEEPLGNAVLDQSGFGNNGTLTGATRSAGKVGSGLNFSGVGGVSIPNSPSLDSLPGGFTMSAWINQVSFTDYQTIFWKTDRYDRIDMLHFQVGDNQNLPTSEGRLYSAMNGPGGPIGPPDFEMIAPRTVDLNEWHFVAWTYDELTGRLWDNGIEVFSAPFTDPWVGNDLDLLIGQHQELAFANFQGMIDEARIYRGALTRDEILRDMNFTGVIPEPSTLIFFGLALSGIAVKRRLYTT